jgi:minor extracellular serine protease Vpr
MKKIIGILAIVAILMIATISFVSADSREGEFVVKPGNELWYVEFHSAPMAYGTSESALDAERTSFEAAAVALELDFSQRYSFRRVWNGISISMPMSEMTKLQSMPEVKAVYRVSTVPIPVVPDGENELDLFTSTAMIGADFVQQELGFDGTGIKVGVIDTGIDFNHPDLGGCNNWAICVLKGWKGYDFVGDAYDGYNTPVEDSQPDDCNGHGTHVAGIIGARGEDVVGVAPNVRFGAYRVFGCDGSASDDVILAAMEMAVVDEMDVVNMSIGSDWFDWPSAPFGAAGDAMVDAGVVLVSSAGNSSEWGLYGHSNPALGDKVISVASMDNKKVYMDYAKVEGDVPNAVDADKVPWAYLEFSEPAPTSGTEVVIPTLNTGCNAGDVPATVSGNLALIQRGTCSFSTKVANAMAQGATGVIVSNSFPNPGVLTSGTLGAPMPGSGPVVGISYDDGAMIESYFFGTGATWEWTGEMKLFPNPTGGLISSFSSYGPSPTLDIKPDISAPGGGIWSTMPLEQGGYGLMSGTSMAAPHVTGAVALLLDANKRGFIEFPLATTDVRAILMNSAKPKKWTLDPDFGKADHVYRQGAGLLDIGAAVTSKVTFTPEKLNLGESSAGIQTRTITVKNDSKIPITYKVGKTSAIAAAGETDPYWFTYWSTDEKVKADEFTVGPMSSTDVVVTFTPPTNAPVQTLYNGWIVFKPQMEEAGDQPVAADFEGFQTYRVSYMGFVGDYQDDMAILDPYYGTPVLVDQYWNSVAEGHVFTLRDLPPHDGEFDYPTIIPWFNHQSEKIQFEILNATTGRVARRFFSLAYDLDLWARSWDSVYVGVFLEEFPWDGYRIFGDTMLSMKDGAYQIRINALKALGDPADPNHWETWTSPMFFIDRHMEP